MEVDGIVMILRTARLQYSVRHREHMVISNCSERSRSMVGRRMAHASLIRKVRLLVPVLLICFIFYPVIGDGEPVAMEQD